MRPRCCLYLTVILIGCLSLGVSSHAQGRRQPELRAFWVDAFSPAFKSPEEADLLLKRLHDAHMNAVFVQMRKGGDAYYASHYEPWAKDAQTHFDSLAYLIEKAHSMSPPVAIHAWINTCAVGGNGSNPFNIVHLHPDWLSLNPDNKDFDNEATKIDPGNPGAADWTFRVYLDIARHYNVDGIHFDFVRYGDKDWGYNPVSLARFESKALGRTDIKRLPNLKPDPTDEIWKQWRRDQVTNLVRKVSLYSKQVNPKVVVSAAVIAWGDAPKNDSEWFTKSAAMNRIYQDWRGWLEEGMIDLACPMTYFQYDYHADWQRNWSRFVKNHQYNRASTVAVGTWFNTIPQNLEMIADAREPLQNGKAPYGVVLYCYTGTNAGEKDATGKRPELKNSADFYDALRQPPSSAPFTYDTPIPEMSWKSEPKKGHLKGVVLTSNLDPVDGAKVEVSFRGKKSTRFTDGTGFYGFVDLPPGKAIVKVSSPGFSAVQVTLSISAGRVQTKTIQLGALSNASSTAISTLKLPSTANGTPVKLEGLKVVLGSDAFPGNLYIVDEKSQGIRVKLDLPPELPFQQGDIVSVRGTLQTLEGERTIAAATAILTDMTPADSINPPMILSGRQILEGKAGTCELISITGEVVQANPEKFIVNSEGMELVVPLAGHKDFGVETLSYRFPIPMLGSKVILTGLLSVGTSNDLNSRYRLHLMGSEGYRLLSGNALLERIGATAIVAGSFRADRWAPNRSSAEKARRSLVYHLK